MPTVWHIVLIELLCESNGTSGCKVAMYHPMDSGVVQMPDLAGWSTLNLSPNGLRRQQVSTLNITTAVTGMDCSFQRNINMASSAHCYTSNTDSTYYLGPTETKNTEQLSLVAARLLLHLPIDQPRPQRPCPRNPLRSPASLSIVDGAIRVMCGLPL